MAKVEKTFNNRYLGGDVGEVGGGLDCVDKKHMDGMWGRRECD